MMRWMPVVKRWVAVVGAVLMFSGCFVFAGCGGGSGDRGNGLITIDGELTENDFDEDRYFDMYEFTAQVPGDATIELKSPDFDSVLIVYRQDGPNLFTEIAADDNSGDGNDARAVVPIEANIRYRVLVTARTRDTGEYELIYSYILGQATQLVTTRDSASVNAMPIPRLTPSADGG